MGVFLATAGQKWPHVFDAAVPSVKCFYHVIDIKDADIRNLMINGVDEKGAIERHPTARKDAEALGKAVITELKARWCRSRKMTVTVLGISGEPVPAREHRDAPRQFP